MPRQSKSSQPEFLNTVLKAVASLKDNHGSTARKIVNQVEATLRTSPRLKSKPRNLVLHIRRALKYGVQNGYLKQRAGRYKIDSEHNISMKISKSFHDESRREKPGLHLKSKKRSSHSSTATASATASTTTASSRSRTSYTTDASSATSRSRTRDRERQAKSKSSRRRKKKQSKSRKKRRRHYSKAHKEYKDPEPDSRNRTPPAPQPDPEPVPEANPPDLERRPSASSSRFRQRRSRHNIDDENNDAEMTSVNCDNEECLCNLKQQSPSHHRVEEGPADDYIN